VSNPEFLREGSAVKDFTIPRSPSSAATTHKAIEKVASLYSDLKGAIEITDIEVAELIKYVNNSYHALKITFANEKWGISANRWA